MCVRAETSLVPECGCVLEERVGVALGGEGQLLDRHAEELAAVGGVKGDAVAGDVGGTFLRAGGWCAGCSVLVEHGTSALDETAEVA